VRRGHRQIIYFLPCPLMGKEGGGEGGERGKLELNLSGEEYSFMDEVFTTFAYELERAGEKGEKDMVNKIQGMRTKRGGKKYFTE